MKKNIVIVGGGTAGWFTALTIKKLLPESNVTLVESKKIGIIGVGEATTPPIVEFLQFLDICPLDLIKHTGGSIKNGISFENWNGDNKKYFHGFREKNDLDIFSINPIFQNGCLEYYLKHLIKNKMNFNEYTYSANLSYNNKIDLNNLNFALHFDTHRLSDYLEKIASKRNINYVVDSFKGLETTETGNIKKIFFNEINLDCDFVFDCSGFARLFIGNHFKEKWISYKNHLPMKKAISFYLPNEEQIKPYTEAIALQNGWIWKIPLQERIGSGYVFDSNYLTDEQAKMEAENFLNKKIEINKVHSFDAGRFENYWIKNCIAVGLSSSFIEPLESTSIHMSIIQLNQLIHFMNNLFVENEHSKSLYNKVVTNSMDEVLNFVYLHYITKRNDSNFWKNFKNNYAPPEKFKNLLQLIKDNNLRHYDVRLEKDMSLSFGLLSYLEVANGLEIFEKEENLENYTNIFPTIDHYKKIIDIKVNDAVSHIDFLKGL